MNEKSLRVLEWPKVRQQVAAKTSFSLSKQAVEALQPSVNFNEVSYQLKLTSDALRLLSVHGEAPFGGANDIRSVVKKASISGILEPDQLLSVGNLLYCSTHLIKYFKDEQGPLAELAGQLGALPKLRSEIARCIDPEGFVKDTASSDLSRIRNRMRTLAARIRERMDNLIHATNMQKILQDPIVTIRNGRYVVPVKSEYRNRLPGIVHDQSGSGATLFMEPAFAVELNNDLNVAEQEEKAEVQRILKQLSGLIALDAETLINNLEIITILDSVFARARYSQTIDGVEPILNDKGEIHIRQGRHPLLAGKVVPIDVWLGEDFHVLVITGPNTGGKTVTLKTVGLFSVMAQAGLHIPADPGSKLSVFEGIFADIGDEQSIEQSLSTFSSHMTTIVGILADLPNNSLVLLDELGAGTDPTEGAALATAILEHLRLKKINTIATTHYSDLKSYAYTRDGVENASVEFDLKTLQPTYRLSIGIPGKSNAFAISRRLGLSEEIVTAAQSLLSSSHVQVEDIIGEMEANRRQAEHARAEGIRFKRQYEELKIKYERLVLELEEQKADILEQARHEAQKLLSDTEAELNQLLGKVRRSEREDLATNIKEYREQVYAKSKSLEQSKRPKPKIDGPANLKIGEQVRIKSLRQTGYVLEMPAGGDVQVQAGIMKITVRLEDLERIESEQPAVVRPQGGTQRARLGKSRSIRNEIDLRGKNVEEGIAMVDKYLDDAFLSSLARVRIIHGKGTGVLGEAIQDYLNGHPHVKSSDYAAPNEGGHGVTIVELHLPT